MPYRLAIRLLALIAILLCLLFIFYFLLYTVEERDVYEIIKREWEQVEKVTTDCLVSDQETEGCQAGFVLQGSMCVACHEGTFSLEGWSACKELLTCDDIHQDVRTRKLWYTIGNWQYFLAEWKEYEVLYAKMTSSETEINFKAMSGSNSAWSNTLIPIGFCENSRSIIFSHDTAYLGPAPQLDSILKQKGCDHWIVRFHLAKNYVHILAQLHTAAGGPLTLCNSNSVEQVLSQFVVSEDLQLVLANFDNLPQASTEDAPIRCSKVELLGDFVAPEQRWPYADRKVFNYDEQPGYDEQSDVWKIPQVTLKIMGNCEECQWILDYLVTVFNECKNPDPATRPRAVAVLREFQTVETLVTDIGDYQYNYGGYM